MALGWFWNIAFDAFGPENIFNSLEIISSHQEFRSSRKCQAWRLPSLIVAADHAVDSEGIQRTFCKFGVDDRWVCPHDNEFFVIAHGCLLFAVNRRRVYDSPKK